MTEKNILYKLLTFATSIGLAVSGWFFNQTFDRLDKLENGVSKLESTSQSQGTQIFSHQDWYMAKTLIEADKLSTEKRLTKLEESIPVIKESLVEIKQTLKELK